MVKLKIQVTDLRGHKVGRIVDQKPLDSDATLDEAIRFGYVVGQKPSIKANIEGVLRCMVDGIQRDGNGRKIDGYLTLNAFAKGIIKDLTDEYTARNVAVRARMLKEFQDKVDSSKFMILIEGATGKANIETVTTGEKSGEIVLGKNVALNGTFLTLAEGDRVEWAVPETGASGTVAAAYVTSDDTRITIGRDGLQELFSPSNNGKDIAFTVTIGGKLTRKLATMIYAA